MSTAVAPPFTEADIAVLLAALGGDVVKCNAKHGEPRWSPECSIEVTHRARVTCAGKTYNICANEAVYLEKCFRSTILCAECDRPVRLCWKLNPI